MEASLIDLEALEGTEGDWLMGEPGLVGPGDEVDWLRRDLEEGVTVSVKKKLLVNKLDNLSRRKDISGLFLSNFLFYVSKMSAYYWTQSQYKTQSTGLDSSLPYF